MSPPAAPRPHAHSQGIAFTAGDIGAAVAQIRSTLGPDAILLNVRRVTPRGLSKLWGKPQIEVLACLPEREDAPPAPPPPPVPPPPASPSLPVATAMQRYARATAAPAPDAEPDAGSEPPPAMDDADPPPSPPPNGWRVPAILDRLGFTALHGQRVLEHVQRLHGPGRHPPASTAQEVALVRTALRQLWRPAPPPAEPASPPLHLLVGPPGTGKSTVLCKWLAQTVLLEAQPARVWRLDGRAPNTAELVSIYGEILQVPVERSWNGRGAPAVPGFVDLPGTDFQDPGALEQLQTLLAALPGATVHLVLNAAYSVPLLLAQARAFAALPVADVIVTHLDEETAWGKLWNLVLGTNFPLRLLSAGQNVPGRFTPARPELLSPALFQGN